MPGFEVTRPGQRLAPVHLPNAPAVIRVGPAPPRRPKGPALALIVLGSVLTLGPIAGGLFSRAAAGQQMIDQFGPHLAPGTLRRYGADIDVLRRAASGVDAVYAAQRLPAGRFPGLDQYRRQSTAIVGRAQGLLDRVSATDADYRRIAGIGGFDRLPFLIVGCGLVAVAEGFALLMGARRRARPSVLLVVVASAAIVGYPFVSGFRGGTAAGARMLQALSPVMTPGQVRQLQDDFIVLVTAVGELDTSFRSVAVTEPPGGEITALVNRWPAVSSDLASLVGTINDNIANFDALRDLDGLTRGVGVSGLKVFPWLLVATGATCAGLSVAALPRAGKESG